MGVDCHRAAASQVHNALEIHRYGKVEAASHDPAGVDCHRAAACQAYSSALEVHKEEAAHPLHNVAAVGGDCYKKTARHTGRHHFRLCCRRHISGHCDDIGAPRGDRHERSQHVHCREADCRAEDSDVSVHNSRHGRVSYRRLPNIRRIFVCCRSSGSQSEQGGPLGRL